VAFPKKLLNEGEDIVLDLRPHWWFMAEPTAAVLATTVVGGLVAAKVNVSNDGLDKAINFLAIGLIVASLVWFGIRYVKWVTINFVVTSDRLIFRSGVIGKTGIEIPLERINTVFFNQTVFERMLGAGDLSIESGGETGKETFRDIRRPSVVQNEIYRQMEANNARMYAGRTTAHGEGGGGAPSITRQIEELDALRQRGVITQAEFDEKKADLLRRM
jgi:uncharacterized membrane protein YdbT with pleckstrin-like domain